MPDCFSLLRGFVTHIFLALGVPLLRIYTDDIILVQRLIFRGHVLKDEKRLNEYGESINKHLLTSNFIANSRNLCIVL